MMEKNWQVETQKFYRDMLDVTNWLCRYWQEIENYPIMSQVKPGSVIKKQLECAPEIGRSIPDIINGLNNDILPAITHWRSPKFMGYFPAGSSEPSVMADFIVSGLGIQGMLWSTSPAATELEMVVTNWLARLLKLPEKFTSNGSGGGILQDSASSSNLIALIVAREKYTDNSGRKQGTPNNLQVYATAEAHSSVEKAVILAGIGLNNFKKVKTNSDLSMDCNDLEKQISNDILQKKKPLIVFATLGTTSTGAFDSIDKIGVICKKYDIWLHVDAAMYGTATICSEYQYLNSGVQHADSYVFNPHKWMLTNLYNSCMFFSDRRVVSEAIRVDPEYLKTNTKDQLFDYRNWQIPLGRRFKALNVWFVLNYFGAETIRAMIRNHIKLTHQCKVELAKHSKIEVVTDNKLNLFTFAHKMGDEATKNLLEKINASGNLFLSHTLYNGRYVIRVCLGQQYVNEKHVAETVAEIFKLI